MTGSGRPGFPGGRASVHNGGGPILRVSLVFAVALLAAPGPSPGLSAQSSSTLLPATLDDLHLVVEPTTREGLTLRLHLDSGAPSALTPDGARRLRFPGVVGGEPVPFPPFRSGDPFPPLVAPDGGEAAIPVREGAPAWSETDGTLGRDWLEGRTWTLDYPGRALLLRDPGDLPLHGPGERLEFLDGEEGWGAPGAPRIPVTLAGEPLVAAIHTAVGAELTAEAVVELADFRPARRAISRMGAASFDALRVRHPEWRVVEGGEVGTGEPLLEIQGLTVASTEIPRVWVLRTPAAAGGGGEGDAPRAGSPSPVLLLGGDVLREFRLTLDFVGRVAIFEPAGFP
jgi:hypothetical protein